MTPQGREAAAATAQLREALERMAAAMTTADLDALLEAEGALEAALHRLAALPETLTLADRDVVRAEVRAARLTLQRCRRLGAALLDVVRLSLEAQGRHTCYGRNNDAAAYAPRTVSARG